MHEMEIATTKRPTFLDRNPPNFAPSAIARHQQTNLTLSRIRDQQTRKFDASISFLTVGYGGTATLRQHMFLTRVSSQSFLCALVSDCGGEIDPNFVCCPQSSIVVILYALCAQTERNKNLNCLQSTSYRLTRITEDKP